ncbi:MAG: hypothetical protein QXQ46_11840 [Thermoplasmatales archaeon]
MGIELHFLHPADLEIINGRMLFELRLNRRYYMDKIFLELEKLQVVEIDAKNVKRERINKQSDILEPLNSITCT